MNDLQADKYYQNNSAMNFTTLLNVSQTVSIDANITGWVTQSGTTSLENTTTWFSTANKPYNITGYFDGNELDRVSAGGLSWH